MSTKTPLGFIIQTKELSDILSDEGRGVFRVYLGDFLFAVDIGLINRFNPAATAVVAARAKLAFSSAIAP